jgi:secreted PhoX family phosphatase
MSAAPPDVLAVDRRRFLQYVGAGAAAIFARPLLALDPRATAGQPAIRAWVDADGAPRWPARRHPIPLPTDLHPIAEDARRLARFEVVDDLVLPDGFGYRVLAQWGDTFGPADAPAQQIDFGYGNDYTGLLPITGQPGHFWLLVNHEYVSGRPWLQAYAEVYGETPPTLRLVEHPQQPSLFTRGLYTFNGFDLPGGNEVDTLDPAAMAAIPPAILAQMRAFARRVLSAVGVSILHVRRSNDGGFEVVRDARDHKRITAFGRQNVAGKPTEHSAFTGPASWLLTQPPAGTMANCSGGTSPWGTFLTCEENFYVDALEEIDPAGQPLEYKKRAFGAIPERSGDLYIFNHPLPPTFSGNGYLLDTPLDGRQFGWVCEVDPQNGHLRKHTALGRFRHENVALRADRGQHLAAYMGDDRRGGHVWKFVSDGVVENPADPRNSRLLEQGTLYVARFHADFSGEWLPLRPATPLRRPEPEQTYSQHCQVPSRYVGGAVAVGDTEKDRPEISVEHWLEIVEDFAGKKFADCTLGDLVRAEGADAGEVERRQQAILLMDAFLMANACGGTPTARPEDLEVHPSDRSVYIAFTEASDSSDGAPDRRIFPDSAKRNSRQYGAIYRILEGGVEGPASDPAATRFTWGKFVSSGEVADQGAGFAFADNLAFDPQGHLWMVTDITTTAQNSPVERTILSGTTPGSANFPGIFGNNAMFFLPTHGPHAGMPYLFATGPVDCELCGPTFSDDGEALLLSVQHPGELDGARSGKAAEERELVLHDRAGQPFRQLRKVPIGSNFPHGQPDRAPRPCVVCITRKR